MKKTFIISFLILVISSTSFSQEMQKTTIFDYSEDKHEFSIDISPVLLGNFPSSLLYRNNYVSKKGKNAAFRLGANFSGTFTSQKNEENPQSTVDLNSHQVNFLIGKEWQKTIQNRILAYYGMDLNLGYGRSSTGGNFINLPETSFSTTNTTYSISAIGFVGLKYHLSRHFSISAESGLNAGFNNSKSSNKTENPNFSENIRRSSLFVDMLPLRAIRFAFHF